MGGNTSVCLNHFSDELNQLRKSLQDCASKEYPGDLDRKAVFERRQECGMNVMDTYMGSTQKC
jgi:hypothetical protein